jgi:2-dehydro-3-deoxygluconokinase
MPGPMKIASIGECMIELTQASAGRLACGYGGDTLNTAIYMARLGLAVDYITALGDSDSWSDQMIAGWQAEGVGTDHVVRVPGKLPGLYMIETGANGERRFYYWRENSAARLLFTLPETPAIQEALAGYDLIYLSGVTLSLYGTEGRKLLMETLQRARAAGAKVAFDTNFRPRGWPDRDVAQRAFNDFFDVSDIVLASVEDLDLCFGEGMSAAVADRIRAPELVVKHLDPACRVRTQDIDQVVIAPPVERVVDTTAAGDSFSAAYLAARMSGAGPVEAAMAGHRLAGVVVRYSGAIVPLDAMPDRAGAKRRQSENAK